MKRRIFLGTLMGVGAVLIVTGSCTTNTLGVTKKTVPMTDSV